MRIMYNFYDYDWEYNIDYDNEKEVAREILKEKNGLDEAQAKTTVEIFVDYDLLDKFLEENKEDVAEYFKDEALEEYRDLWR